MQETQALKAVLRRDRLLVLAGLAGITLLAWAYIGYLSWGMNHMDPMDMSMEMTMPQVQGWGLVDFALTVVMWSVMMVAMMVPSAAPMILLFANVNRKRQEQERPYIPTSVFLLGYLAVWAGFSVLAALAQWGLHNAALLSPMMVNTSPLLGGVLLVAAGLFQWTPLKYACLHSCRSPLGFIMQEWREGTWGTFRMGLKHGSYCVGCCWTLMLLLFVAGVMNLLWVAAIAGWVLIEKLAPAGHWLGRGVGVLLIAIGIWMAVAVL
jgi:predicted metal-binding membrane protein